MKRVSFLIAPDLLERLRLLKARTGVTESEQIREGIRMWLESHEWPANKSVKRVDRGGSDGQ
jgi:predicted DNA-binding protein